MVNYLKIIVETTSTVCLVCSIYYWTRSRTNGKMRKRAFSVPPSSSMPHLSQDLLAVTYTTNGVDENTMLSPQVSVQPAADSIGSGGSSDHFLLKACDGGADPAIDGTNQFEANDVASTSIPPTASSSLLSRSLTAVVDYWSRMTGRGKAIDLCQEPEAVQPSLDEVPITDPPFQSLTKEELTEAMRMIRQLAEQAGIATKQSRTATSTKRARLSQSIRNNQKSVYFLLESMISYTKNDRFIDLFYASPMCQPLLDRLCRWGICLTPVEEASCGDRTYPTTRKPIAQRPASGLDGPEEDSAEVAEAGESMPVTDRRHGEYPFHLLLASLLANLSRRHHTIFASEYVTTLLAVWSKSPSLHLTLLAEKILCNVATLQSNPQLDLPIYYPSIYLLNSCKQASSALPVERNEDYDVDVVFVHGMSGSVFFTWRQNDSHGSVSSPSTDGATTKCWPRDWLAEEFPRARIIGIDSSLRPFIWNSACPIDNSKRSLRVRADDLRQQLAAARVGRRPVIWVTHSAGGVLVKELLRVSHQPMDHQFNSTASFSSQQDFAFLPHITSAWDLMDKQQPLGLSRSASSNDIHFSSSPQHSSPIVPRRLHSHSSGLPREHRCTSPHNMTGSALCTSGYSSGLAEQTRGIVFISVPHRGNSSLSVLFFRPIRWTLTPEAIELERNNDYLLGLHSWFNLWATRCNVPVLTMTETLPTIVNRFYSVVLVPEDARDREMGKVVRIPSDHLYISKPTSPNDLVYTSIAQFIRNIVAR